ncbi:hypothetical protein EEL31_06375 [Brevibacillus laterosporus]|nr:geobacillin-26 family protein [Brevibacillus laterosporus]TPG68193.1 hypothetical protein EEL31_06375 [Brevibacillus laterosporus]
MKKYLGGSILWKVITGTTLSVLTLFSVIAPVSAVEVQYVEYVKEMNEELKLNKSAAEHGVQFEYIKNDGVIKETRVTTNDGDIISKLNQETNEFELIVNGESTKIDLDEPRFKAKKFSLASISPDQEGEAETYEASYQVFMDYYKNQNFHILEWNGKMRNTFENSDIEDYIANFEDSVDTLSSLENKLDRSLIADRITYSLASIIAAMCVNPPLGLTIGILTAIVGEFGLRMKQQDIMEEMIAPAKKAERAFQKIKSNSPKNLKNLLPIQEVSEAS